MKLLAGFTMGWFLAIFSTHNYGWLLSLNTGWCLLGITIFGLIMVKAVGNNDALVSRGEE